MIRVGLYTPTPKGWISQRTANTTLADARWCAGQGYETLDMSAIVEPGNSIEVGRNTAVLRAAAADCTHLRMIDADTSCGWDESLIAQLWGPMQKHGAVACAATVEVHGGRAGKSNVVPVQRGAYIAQYVSAAAILLDLGRLRALPWPARTPHFWRLYNDAATQQTLDEGFWFCQHLRACGGTVVACSVKTWHSPPGR